MISSLGCIFCQLVEKKESPESFIIEENEHAIALLDINPVSEGHTLIISKKHFENVVSSDQETWNSFLPIINSVIKRIEMNLGIKNFNLISNIGSLAFQTVFHSHLHIIPKIAKNRGLLWAVERDIKMSLIEIHKKLSRNDSPHVFKFKSIE